MIAKQELTEIKKETNLYYDKPPMESNQAYIGYSEISLPHLNSISDLIETRNDVIQCTTVRIKNNRQIAVVKFSKRLNPTKNLNRMTSLVLDWIEAIPKEDKNLIDTISVGSSIGPLAETIEAAKRKNPRPRDIYLGFHQSITSEIAHFLNKDLFPLYSNSGCVAGLQAIGLLYDRIKLGKSCTGLALAIDYPIPNRLLIAYSRLGMLKENSLDGNFHSPWQPDSQGMIISEGVAGIIINPYPQHTDNGIRIIGWDIKTDGYHPFHINPSPDKICAVMSNSIKDRNRGVHTVLIMAHANAIYKEDIIELEAIKQFAKLNNIDNVLVSTIKNRIGHPLSAGGTIQVQMAANLLKDPSLIHKVTHFAIQNNRFVDFNSKIVFPEPEIAIINARSFGSIYASMALERM